MGGPGITGFGLVESRFPWDRRNVNEVVTGRTFDLSAGKLFVACQMLLAMGTFKSEFAHRLLAFVV